MNVAFIPVRGGSKSIPLKNIKMMCGQPLVYWVVRAACECRHIDAVYVSTDSQEIRQAVEGFGLEKVQVVDRSADTATDQATTESAMLEFAARHVFDTMVLIQATAPLLEGADLDRGFDTYLQPDVDSVLSVVRQKRFIWNADNDGNVAPINYRIDARPRRQDFDGFLVENGAFYITSREALLRTQNRMSGCIRAVEMPEETFYEIDEPRDWTIVETFLQERQMENAATQLPVRLFLTDCDGCLTDAGMYYTETGDEIKKFNTYDGVGLAMLKDRGIPRGIVTSEDVALVRRRAKKLGLEVLRMGVRDKLAVVRELCEEYGIGLEQVAYVGDDLGDLPVVKAVGYGFCVANAVPAVKAAAKHITCARGGEGAIREVVEWLIAENKIHSSETAGK